jgi:hypothetical protein
MLEAAGGLQALSQPADAAAVVVVVEMKSGTHRVPYDDCH